MDKLEAHQKNELHRAFSVFIFNPKGQMLLQKRADAKYHSPGLWTNACCSHQSPGEDSVAAGKRRLQEEIGMKVESLEHTGHLLYQCDFENGLHEHEFDHILIGQTEDEPVLNPEEASAFRWVNKDQLAEELSANPSAFTFWFKEIMNQELVSFPDLKDNLDA